MNDLKLQKRMATLFTGFAAARAGSVGGDLQAVRRFSSLLDGFSHARQRKSKVESKRTVRFAELLQRYGALQIRSTQEALAGAAESAGRFKIFAEGFREACRSAEARGMEKARGQRGNFARLLEGHTKKLEDWEKSQGDVADRFDILQVLDLTTNEERHSRMLAWLLDPSCRKLGTHAQGNLGFRLLLAELKLPAIMADTAYSVRREVPGRMSRIDIEVAAPGRFLIHIEVKIGAAEGANETKREWDDLCRRAKAIGIDADRADCNVVALYLTPTGKPAGEPNFKAISWSQIARVLDRFAEVARPAEVKLFARHYSKALRRFIISVDTFERKELDGGAII